MLGLAPATTSEARQQSAEGLEDLPTASCQAHRWQLYDVLWTPVEDGDELSDEEAALAAQSARNVRAARALGGVLSAVAFVVLCVLSATERPQSQQTGAFMRPASQEREVQDLIGMDEASGSWAGAGKCGVASNMLDYNDPAMSTFCNMDLDFWWNWAPVPRNAYSAPCALPKFVPMIWGSGVDNKWIARKAGETFGFLMGYNEPDLWGPPPHPGDQYLSSGTFSPTFHCGSPDLAKEWRDMVTFYKQTSPFGTIVSPAVADPSRFASTGGDAAACNASPQTWESHMPWCLGWMKCFKENVIQLDCGGGLNCWDAIDVLQFHAYEYQAEALISKVKSWETTWADELQGLNGRRKKTLWLTEFAHAGTTDPNDPAAMAFMEQTVEYMKSSPYVSGWSWFSQTFSSFTIDDITPASPYWFSELIDKTGQSTPLGRKYQEICAQIPPAPVLTA